MLKPFSVSLQGVEDLPQAERISAEVRFIKELERSLGGEEDVVRVYRAWSEAAEDEAGELDAETSSLAVKWPNDSRKHQLPVAARYATLPLHNEIALG
jgi:hypothetical protein